MERNMENACSTTSTKSLNLKLKWCFLSRLLFDFRSWCVGFTRTWQQNMWRGSWRGKSSWRTESFRKRPTALWETTQRVCTIYLWKRWDWSTTCQSIALKQNSGCNMLLFSIRNWTSHTLINSKNSFGFYLEESWRLKWWNYFTGITWGLAEGNHVQDCRSVETPRPSCHTDASSITGNCFSWPQVTSAALTETDVQLSVISTSTDSTSQ